MYGISDAKLAKLDKQQFEEDWKRQKIAESDAIKQAVDAEFDAYAVPQVYAMGNGSCMIGMPCTDCSLGGGMGFFA